VLTEGAIVCCDEAVGLTPGAAEGSTDGNLEDPGAADGAGAVLVAAEAPGDI